MAYYKVTKKQSGAIVPTFTETVIADNSSRNASFTFDYDYHNYDFLKFKIYNGATAKYLYILTTPSTIDAIFDITDVVCFNDYNTNRYSCYSQSNLTWTRTSSRNLDIYEVIGANCNNATVTETELYKATARTSTAVTVTTQENLMNFDWIMFSCNSSAHDELQPCNNIYTSVNHIVPYMFNGYNTDIYEVTVGTNTISAGKYCYIAGIKFT